ncbi:hypothetical protein [Streptomyces chryseus]|uniref:hypothetical protein n=1 Tax=Streptomyces chryseus TaxID=68186 RepID=UPI00110FD50A|nr:hypothetical protein [Streptomyces chryseus]GGX36618.1 hypothetical protein GCM10010353_59670 [Streptomyces chryseus]
MATDYRPPEHDKPASPYASRWFLASAAFVAVVVLLLAVVILSGGRNDDPPQARPSAPAETEAAEPTTADDQSGGDCPKLPDTGTTVPKNPPAGVRWELVDSFALPVSEKAGPARTDGDVARCYAHSPTGALLAMSQITGRMLTAKDWREITDRQTTGEGKQAYIDQRVTYEEDEGPARVGPDEHGQIAGFKFVTYSPSSAVIDLVFRAKDGTLRAGTSTVLWTGGDWKFEILPSPPPGSTIDNLAGYVPWGGV